MLHTANCTIIDHFSALEFNLVAQFLTLPLKNGWQWVKTARNVNIGVSRNRFCDFLADPDSRSFSRFGAIIMQFAVPPSSGPPNAMTRHHQNANEGPSIVPAPAIGSIYDRPGRVRWIYFGATGTRSKPRMACRSSSLLRKSPT
jgi:hypothetical protein